MHKVCPCMPLKTGVKLVAIVDAVFSILLFVFIILGAIALQYSDEELGLSTGERTQAVIGFIIIGTVSLAQICAAGVLHSSSNKANPALGIRGWLITTIIIVAFFALNTIGAIKASSGGLAAFYIFTIIYKIYAMVVVITFDKSKSGENGFVYSNTI